MTHALRSPTLLPGEREALANEMLEQQFQYRQNMALLHGLPMPSGPGKVTRRDIEQPAADDTTTDQPQTPVTPTTGENTGNGSTSDTTAEPKTGLWDKVKKGALATALVAGGASIPFLGGLGAGMMNKEPVTQEAPAQPETPATTAPTTTAPTTDNNSQLLLLELAKRGYNVAPTDLGEDIQKAFQLNPELRDQLLRDVQRTLEENGVKPGTQR